MRYVFICPDFIADLYFCPHEGAGLRLSSQLEDAIMADSPESAARIAERLACQSGFRVVARPCLFAYTIRQVVWHDRPAFSATTSNH